MAYPQKSRILLNAWPRNAGLGSPERGGSDVPFAGKLSLE